MKALRIAVGIVVTVALVFDYSRGGGYDAHAATTPAFGASSQTTSVCSQTVLYSQTNLVGSTGITPGLYHQLGLLAGPDSTVSEFYEIITNDTGKEVLVNKVFLFGSVSKPSTAVLAPVVIGSTDRISNILIPDRNSDHMLAIAAVPVGSTKEPGLIEINFSPGVSIPAGGQFAFGFIVPLATIVDATLYGTDMGPNNFSSTTPSYYTGFYGTNGSGTLFDAIGNHYLVVESVTPTIQEIMSLFDASVQDGLLSGSGPGNSAAERLLALRHMLENASDLIGRGAISKAIVQLQDAELRIVSNPQSDFVTGEAALYLAAKVQQLIACLAG